MLNSIKDNKGVSQIFKKTKSLEARTMNRCKKIIKNASINEKTKVLELGCGIGDYARLIYKLTGASIVAMDINEDFINQANSVDNSSRIRFVVGDVFHLPFPDSSFDLIYGNGILHHLEDKQKIFREIKRVLNESGRIVFLEPNIINPIVYLIFQPRMKKLFNLDPIEAPFRKNYIKLQLEEQEFINIKIYAIDFILPITPSFLLPTIIVLNKLLEKTPIIKEISQSILIYAKKR